MENQRIRVSKYMLKEALCRLLKTKSIEKITIYELCKEAQINRTTFYKYYGNQYDLLKEIQEELFQELNERLEKCEKGGSGLYSVLKLLQDEKERFVTLINTASDEEFCEKLFNLPIIKQELTSLILTDRSPKETEYVYLFFCQGGYAIARKWLNEENPEPPEVIAKLLHNLVQSILT